MRLVECVVAWPSYLDRKSSQIHGERERAHLPHKMCMWRIIPCMTHQSRRRLGWPSKHEHALQLRTLSLLRTP